MARGIRLPSLRRRHAPQLSAEAEDSLTHAERVDRILERAPEEVRAQPRATTDDAMADKLHVSEGR